MDTAEKLRDFIIDNFMYGRSPEELKNDDSLLEKGIIDSTGVLELVSFLEQTFGITVEDEELIPENLDSVNRLAAYLTKKSK